MDKINCMKFLTESAIDVNRNYFFTLSEEAKIQVTDDAITSMMRFITDKYNSIDFSEIEKSSGDIDKFKYSGMLRENAETLRNIYQSSSDTGAEKYVKVCDSIIRVLDHLKVDRNNYREQYQSGNGLIQLLYTSLVSSCIYCIGTLVSNTIRFVTTDTETDCEVMYDEIPGTVKHVHIKNVLSAANDIPTFHKLLESYNKSGVKTAVTESVSLAGVTVAAFGVVAVIALIPRILVLIREIIYSVYFTRVKVSDMLGVQVDLINTNIESLKTGRGSSKVIARQKRIAQKLEKWKNRIAVKTDTVNTLVNVQKNKENATLKIDEDSPIVQDPGSYAAGDLML